MEGMGTMSQMNTGLYMSNSFSFSLKVSFILHNISHKFWLDSSRYAGGWEVCHEAETQNEKNILLFIWLEAEDSSKEGEENKGFRGINPK